MLKFEMGDGNIVETKLITREEQLESCLDQLWDHIIKGGNPKVIGFELDWRQESKYGVGPGIVRLILGTDVTCFILDSELLGWAILKNFLGLKDITFVGISITKDLAKLEKDYGFVVRNVVDLSEHAANVIPKFRTCSLSEWANAMKLEVKEKPASVAFHSQIFGPEHLEHAAIDTYALFKIGKKLLKRDYYLWFNFIDD